MPDECLRCHHGRRVGRGVRARKQLERRDGLRRPQSDINSIILARQDPLCSPSGISGPLDKHCSAA